MQDQSPWIVQADNTPCLLRALIADFGGEATCLGMSRKLGRFIEASGIGQSETRAWVRDQFSMLEGRGDVTVELTDTSTFIARITEAGACRAAG